MARRGKRKSAPTRTAESKPSIDLGTILIGLALVIGALAIVQWFQLLSIQNGGTTFCSINENLDCEAVWNSEFAKSIHRGTLLPIAAWGLVFAFAALAAAYRFHRFHRAGKKEAEPIWAVRFVGAIGAVTSLVLLIASWSMGVFCITCILTYTLVTAYVVIAFRVPSIRPLSQTKPGRIVVVPALYVVLGWVLLLWPASATPIEPKTHLPPPKTETVAQKSELELYLERLPKEVQQAISDSLETMRRSPAVPRRTPRRLHGNPTAQVRFMDFSDVRCTHCRQLDKVMQELDQTAVAGSFSLESRFFPLDGGCNPKMPKDGVDPTGVRCLGPKLLICLEGKDGYEKARHRIFDEQTSLTEESLWEIATEDGGATKEELEKCIADPALAAKMKDDLEYALQYEIEGTPLLVVNGKRATPLPSFLYAIVLAGGDPDHRAFANLPKPRPPIPHQH